MRHVERWVLLRSIDTHWVEHLTQMDELREGIYLRGYGQQDPLIAYKNEAHRYWEEMNARIAASAAQMILRVSVRPVEQTEQRQEERVTRAAQGTASGGGLERAPVRRPVAVAAGAASGAASGARGPEPAGKNKIGRNDPCYCGSGKKYKKCHGR
jgi:preprotein translocase subunit SecA